MAHRTGSGSRPKVAKWKVVLPVGLRLSSSRTLGCINDFWDPESKKHLTVLVTLDSTLVFSRSIAVGRAILPLQDEARVDILEVMTE